MKTRQKFVLDVIEKYKMDNPDDYSKFLDLMDYKRTLLNDKKFAKVKGQTEMRQTVSMPDKLYNQLSYVLDGVNEEKFLESKGEMKWFIKKFPEFLIGYSY